MARDPLARSYAEDGQLAPSVDVTTFKIDGVEVTATAAEINKLAGAAAGLTAAELSILDGVTATAAELNKLAGITGGVVQSQEITFTEDASNTSHVGNIVVPAGATILEIMVHNTVLWTATSASLEVGEVSDNADGYYTAVDLKATDLLAGEALTLAAAGGVEGAYAIGTLTHWENLYNASARTIRGTITVGTPATTVGRTRLVVTYVLPVSVAATSS